MENSSGHENRLDVEMARRGLSRSRSAAADLIKRGKVTVGGIVATKPSTEVSESTQITLSPEARFVSRAGEKLERALSTFGINVTNFEVIDVGSSTGGFVDCLLSHGARHVVAIDVGTDQLVSSLRSDPRVESIEGTDIRTYAAKHSADGRQFDLATIDVSFISLSHVLPKVFELLSPGGSCITLVKPQFEVGKEIADEFKGIIHDDTVRMQALESVKTIARSAGFEIVAEADSPIEGEKGNREFLLHLHKPTR
ncbi:MAG TPA: TlyA family RNA methyltransferase [Candidatus Paceibacterota bacterium]